ncbi:MAG: hypothetical protein ABFD96_25015 [Armatimonadia bacterium]
MTAFFIGVGVGALFIGAFALLVFERLGRHVDRLRHFGPPELPEFRPRQAQPRVVTRLTKDHLTWEI